LFYGGMRAGEQAGTDKVSRIAADPVGSRVRRTTWARRDEQRAKSARLVIVCSLFLVLVAGALLVGGHAVIDPLLQSAAAAREAKRVGEIVYSMPDRTFCRHLSFDNATAELSEGAVEECPRDLATKRVRQPTGFAWGGGR
jgi:hypothetical protein